MPIWGFLSNCCLGRCTQCSGKRELETGAGSIVARKKKVIWLKGDKIKCFMRTKEDDLGLMLPGILSNFSSSCMVSLFYVFLLIPY